VKLENKIQRNLARRSVRPLFPIGRIGSPADSTCRRTRRCPVPDAFQHPANRGAGPRIAVRRSTPPAV